MSKYLLLIARLELGIESRSKIAESGHKPMKVQVRVHRMDKGVTRILKDADGMFLRAEPQEEELKPNGESPNAETVGGREKEDGEQSLESLKQAFEETRVHNKSLVEGISSIKDELLASKNRVQQLWQVSCD